MFRRPFRYFDYKGNIIPEHLRAIYIPGKRKLAIDENQNSK